MTLNFHPPHFYLVIQVTLCNHVDQEKIISWNQFFFLLEVNFQTKNNDSKLHRLFFTTYQWILKKYRWRDCEKSSIFFNLFINPFPLSHMQYFNRVVKLGHKYTELANKNKISQKYLATLTKITQIGGTLQRAIVCASLHKGDVLFIPFFLACQELSHIIRLRAWKMLTSWTISLCWEGLMAGRGLLMLPGCLP